MLWQVLISFLAIPYILTYVLAHFHAWEKARILHRDISVGNILIDIYSDERFPNGYLSDWDLSKKESQLKYASQHGQSVSPH